MTLQNKQIEFLLAFIGSRYGSFERNRKYGKEKIKVFL